MLRFLKFFFGWRPPAAVSLWRAGMRGAALFFRVGLRCRVLRTAIGVMCSLPMLPQSSAAIELPSIGARIFAQPFHWVEDNGEPVQFSKWQDRPTILTMAYSNCRRVCLATLHRLEQAQELADRQHLAVEFLIVSFDPVNDTPQTWANYRRHHDLAQRPNWHFLTGSEGGTRKLAGMLGINYWMDIDHVIHDFKIMYFNPKSGTERFVDWDHQDISIFFKE